MNRTMKFSLAVACTLGAGLVSVVEAQPQKHDVGIWDVYIDKETFNLHAIHAIALKSGKVLFLTKKAASPNIVLLDPSDDSVSVPASEHQSPQDFYCSGHCQIDGKVLFAGGGEDTQGHEFVATFDPDLLDKDPPENPWQQMGNMPLPGDKRWYPTLTTLGTGKVLVTGGRDDNTCDRNCTETPYEDTPLLFDPSLPPGPGQWSYLGNPDPPDYERGAKVVHWYPFMFQISDGKLFMAGGANFNPLEDASIHLDTYKLNVALEKWESPAVSRAELPGMSAVMYRPDKIMKVACGVICSTEGDKTVQIIDLAPGSISPWTTVDEMKWARQHMTLFVLPDGRVLAVGGLEQPTGRESEWYDPDEANPQWQALAAPADRRTYHSSGVLLRDARVVIAGGEVSVPGPHQETAEIFKPPYLFDMFDQPAPRPQITSAPEEIHYGTGFQVTTPDAAVISKVSLIRLGAQTHSFDQNARYVPLEFTNSTVNELTVAPRAQVNLAPPGYYMLFILKPGDRSGIEYPSVAEIVRLTSSTP